MVRVSVVLPAYNMEKYIQSAINSVLNQTFKDFEIIIVDDGSTDCTRDKTLIYKNKIRYIYQQNSGVAAAINTGIKSSKGEYFIWLSPDDEFTPTLLEEEARVLDRNPDVDIVYTDFYYINQQGEITGANKCPFYPDRDRMVQEFFKNCFINGSTVMVRSKLFEDVGYYDESLRYSPDSDMWFRCLKNHKFMHIPAPLVKYRLHENQLSYHSKEMERSRRIVIKRARKLYGYKWGIYRNLLFEGKILMRTLLGYIIPKTFIMKYRFRKNKPEKQNKEKSNK